MGILVPEANLPMGVTLSNVYMSFSGETIYVSPRGKEFGEYRIHTWYRVYKDVSKDPDTNIRIPIMVTVPDISRGVYTLLYEQLKMSYPGSEDILNTQ